MLENKLPLQIELERKHSVAGAMKFMTEFDDACERGEMFSTIAGGRLLKEHIDLCIEKFQASKSKIKKFVSKVDTRVVVFIALRTIINECARQQDKDAALIKICREIGKTIELEYNLALFAEHNKVYFDRMTADMKRRNTGRHHKRNAVKHLADKHSIPHEKWSPELQSKIGLNLARLILQTVPYFDVVSIRTQNTRIKFNAETKDYIQRQNEFLKVFRVSKPPCIMPPLDWTAHNRGGYHSKEQSINTHFVNAYENKEFYRKHFEDSPDAIKTCNILQRTEWVINKPLLDVLHIVWKQNLQIKIPSTVPIEMPIYGKDLDRNNEEQMKEFKEWKYNMRDLYSDERQRFGRALAVSRMITSANEMKEYEKLYFVYSLDFRSRFNAVSTGISPQGADYTKACLMFANPKKLGVRGAVWLKIHGANTFGVDKVTFDERIAWTNKNHKLICAAADDPISMKDFWGEADKPFQFLAFCMEYKKFDREGVDAYCSIPLGLDGACNGLQHYSALVLDEVGAEKTAVSPTDAPADIYQSVADVVIVKLNNRSDPLAKAWLDFGISRKICKKPVMTLPYGSTEYTCFKAVMAHLGEYDHAFENPNEAGVYLKKVIWESIAEVVISAVATMEWLRQVAKIITKADEDIKWATPINFKVLLNKKKNKSVCIDSYAYGSRLQIMCNTATTVRDVNRHQSGIAPDFIHSMDAAHLSKTINACYDKGLRDFACIHDDFGTHACDMDILYQEIRTQFVEIYKVDHLQKIVDAYPHLDFPPLPKKGKLDIEDVLMSKYIFH